MVTSSECLAKYGYPSIEMERKHLMLWDIPENINRDIPALPNKVYCNRDLVSPLMAAFHNIIARGLQKQIKTWDGCFNIRKKKGSAALSLHSWAIAIDINAAWNGWKQVPQMSAELVKCFTDAGFEWGGNWKTQDGMHFQLKKI